MKKIIWLLVLLLGTTPSVALALDWTYPFVVWNGNVYEVTEEEIVENDLGKVIGHVKRTANDRTGNYYGDASNSYPKGTQYYELNGISPESAIAVEVKDSQWVKAIYLHRVPFHWMNLFLKILLFFIVIFVGVTIAHSIKNKK